MAALMTESLRMDVAFHTVFPGYLPVGVPKGQWKSC